ncbi:UNVERIFIED_CONTAM: hypothetical protein Slati_3978800 [Sesamum latifolium]|uniref:Uncharacterized protein n=1 Tax=Sesamum latifolium TaxID=2727402 RepID=A0AAW2TQ98_9LAMI
MRLREQTLLTWGASSSRARAPLSPFSGTSAVVRVIISTWASTTNCARTVEVIIFCIVSNNPEDNLQKMVLVEVLLCRGSMGSTGP